ncbi:MAG: ATP-binding cassette domain-containing protein [Flavobacteriales bacterium]|nr:ATP-binding cassette domain-containing protein [Flavobacteriales bacterium]
MSEETTTAATSTPDTKAKNGPVMLIKDLSKAFGELKVLSGFSAELMQGENLVVLGKSGSGKSVLIKCIVGLLSYDSGSITVMGDEVSALNRKELNVMRQKVGFLFQSGALYDSMTVRENLMFPLTRIRKDLCADEMEAKIKEVLENVGLADAIDKMPSELSGGMRKRISLARTIVVDPDIMLYDEPTTGLDPVTSDEISSLILDVQKKYRTSSIIITHDIKCARKVADRILMINDGKVHLMGTPKEFEESDDELVASFFN